MLAIIILVIITPGHQLIGVVEAIAGDGICQVVWRAREESSGKKQLPPPFLQEASAKGMFWDPGLTFVMDVA